MQAPWTKCLECDLDVLMAVILHGCPRPLCLPEIRHITDYGIDDPFAVTPYTWHGVGIEITILRQITRIGVAGVGHTGVVENDKTVEMESKGCVSESLVQHLQLVVHIRQGD